MLRLPHLLVIIIVAVTVAACSSSAAPGWTFAPAPSATPVASAAASGGPSGAPSAAASAPAAGSPGPSAQAIPSGSGVAAGLTITAAVGSATAGWDPPTAETAAGTPFTMTFDNVDNTVPHNLVLQDGAGTAVAIQGDTAPFTGPGKRDYQVPALTAGDYKYICQVHQATMVGTLTVN